MNAKDVASSARVGAINKIRYAKDVLWSNYFGTRSPEDFETIFRNIDEYDRLCTKTLGKPLQDCSVLEIGFGQRPLRLFTLACLGVKVRGVDIEHPTLSIKDIWRVKRLNGAYRALKGAVRFCTLDAKFYRQFANAFEKRYGKPFARHIECLTVADATKIDFWRSLQKPIDFLYSEDVFEHIPGERLSELIGHMYNAMASPSVALIRPMVFTGIAGGHHIDWYTGTFHKPTRRSTPAWNHLLENDCAADTYLNGFRREDYKRILSEKFRLIEDVAELGRLGQEYLTPVLRERLSKWSDYELFSNTVRFVLAKD